MHLNDLYREARSSGKPAENLLFENLSVSFRLITQYRIGNRLDAEEVAQEALMAVARRYQELDTDANFAAWAYKVLRNKVLDYFKAKKPAAASLDDIGTDALHHGSIDIEPLLRESLVNCLKKIDRVNRHFARILNLRFQGYSTKEICAKLKVTSGNVHVILHRARLLLERCLDTGDL